MQLPSLDKFPHALVITGNRQANLVTLKDFLEKNAISTIGNSDVYIFDQESIKIDELRDQVISFLSNQKVSDKRLVIISVDQFGFEAQNAFLKNLEEPQEGTHIVILVSDRKKLLPTILSRSQIIQGESFVGESRLDVNEFIKQKTDERFSYIETWTKAKKDEDNVSKTEIINFIDQLENLLWDKKNRNEQLFVDIRKMREYVAIRGASHRVILDFLAMVVPSKL